MTNGVPFGIEGNTLEEREANWKKILDQMIEGFELHKRRDDWNLTKKEYTKIHRGLKLFAKYYFNLWW